MNVETELMIYKHIVSEYGHLDFDEIKDRKNGCEYMDCVMMEYGIRDNDNWDKEMLKQHYIFRYFFDEYNDWWDWYVEEYDEEPINVKSDFDIKKVLEELDNID